MTLVHLGYPMIIGFVLLSTGSVVPFPIPVLIQALKYGWEFTGPIAAVRLAERGEAAIPALVQAPRDENPMRREEAARAINMLAARDAKAWKVLQQEATEALIAAMADPSETVRVRAADAIITIDERPEHVRDICHSLATVWQGSNDRARNYARDVSIRLHGHYTRELVAAVKKAAAGESEVAEETLGVISR